MNLPMSHHAPQYPLSNMDKVSISNSLALQPAMEAPNRPEHRGNAVPLWSSWYWYKITLPAEREQYAFWQESQITSAYWICKRKTDPANFLLNQATVLKLVLQTLAILYSINATWVEEGQHQVVRMMQTGLLTFELHFTSYFTHVRQKYNKTVKLKLTESDAQGQKVLWQSCILVSV